ncbi:MULTISPECIES: hypothetical protein [Sorangium]|uniref:Uncharacterized protein n=1 Tax=Sorangium cellulosum TaxID=56 RepID=A0A4P2R364_SORCE|nr:MULTISPECIES: hypothetical protein [Sorangium]AUX37460.1 uncharacterized protein SOCE836_096840 [Sorangium cellulosum]WCQ96750.1 hypothetical protein NQZ70_09537 [Sorangium sp. Soce836]
MVVLEIKPDETKETDDPRVQLTLRDGVYRFQLVVEDQAGNQSKPVELDVVVRNPVRSPFPQ